MGKVVTVRGDKMQLCGDRSAVFFHFIEVAKFD